MTRSNSPRGNVLLIAMIAVVVLTVLVTGAIQFTGQNRVAASLKSRGDRLSACAEASRNYLLSQLRQLGQKPTIISINERIPDHPTPSKQSSVRTAHYKGPVVLSIATVGGKSVSNVNTNRDLSNVITASGSGAGDHYRVIVSCREPNGQESETEFLFRYGL